MLDATKSEEQRRLLEIELDAVGIRLNKRKPDVVFKRRTTGGVSCTVVPSSLTTEFLFHTRSPYGISLLYCQPNCDTLPSQLTTTVKLTKTDEKTIRTILASCGDLLL